MAKDKKDSNKKEKPGFFSSTAIPEKIKQRYRTTNAENVIRSLAQEKARRSVAENEQSSTNSENTQYNNNSSTGSEEPQTITFANAVAQAKQTLSTINPSAIRNMGDQQAIQYAKSSISDMEQKMAQISSLSAGTSSKPNRKPTENNVANTNTNLTHYTNNVTQMTTDYMRNIKASYEKTPQWRVDMG